MEFLVKFETSTKVVNVNDITNLQNEVKSAFGIDSQADVAMQRYDQSWDEFIDINEHELREVKDRERLKCVLVSKHTHFDQFETSFPDQRSTSLSDISDATSTSRHSIESWPEEFVMPVHKYSRQLKKDSSESHTLNWSCKHEFLGIVTDEIFRYTYYPNNHQIVTVAKCIVKTHTNLTEKIGCGYDGWAQSLRDRLKNARRKMEIPVVTWRKRKSDVNTCNATGRKSKKMTDLHTLSFPSGEDETSCKVHVENLKKAVKNPDRDISLIKKLMNTTFAYRRLYVLESPTVSALLTEYPSLRIREILIEEMCQIKEKETHKVFLDNLTAYAASIIQLARKKTTCKSIISTLKDLDNSINDLPEVTPKRVAECEAVAALLVLPALLGEDSKKFINQFAEGSTLEDYKLVAPRSPHLAIYGPLFQPQSCTGYTLSEGKVVTTVESIPEGIFEAFCQFYTFNIEYPLTAKNTWAFLHVIAEISDEKPPKKVLTLRGKL